MHLLMLALVLLTHVRDRPVETPAIQLELMPRQAEQPRRGRPTAPPRPMQALAPVRTAPDLPAPIAPAPIAPAAGSGDDLAAAPSPGRGVSTVGQTVFPGAPSAGGVLRRTVGCSHAEYVKLSPAEQAACDRQFAGARPKAQEIAQAIDKAMDAANGTGPSAQAARQNQAKRRYLEAPGDAGYTSLRCNLAGRC